MKNKLSPIEELRKEKLLLREDVKQHEEALKNNFVYAKNNLGNLILSSAFSYSVNSMKNAFGLGGTSTSEKKGFLDKAVTIITNIWPFIEPIVIGFITKKLTGFLFGKDKK